MKYFVIAILLTFGSCGFAQPQTQTYTTGKTFEEIGRTDYCGTISAVYFVQRDKPVTIDNSLSYASAVMNDSILKARVKKINHPQNVVQDTSEVIDLRRALIDVITYANTKQKIKGLKPAEIFEKTASRTSGQYALYFVSTGFVKDSVMLRKEKVRRLVNSLTVTVGGIAGAAGGLMLGFYIKPAKVTLGEDALTWVGAYDGKSRLNGYIIVYDKTQKEICFYRSVMFLKDRDPLDEDSIVKQLKFVFKETFY